MAHAWASRSPPWPVHMERCTVHTRVITCPVCALLWDSKRASLRLPHLSSGHRHKALEPGALDHRNLFSHTSKGWTFQLRVPVGWILMRPLFLAGGQLSPLCPHTARWGAGLGKGVGGREKGGSGREKTLVSLLVKI